MDWITLYIAGKPGFRQEVLENLDRSKFPYLPGTPENDSLCLFWMKDSSSLRDLKKAIGSKTVFKYRLNFFPSLEKYFESIRDKHEITFTPREQALISEMSTKETVRNQYRNSA